MSTFDLTKTRPFSFRTPEDITAENLNKLIEWIESNLSDIESETQSQDDRLTDGGL